MFPQAELGPGKSLLTPLDIFLLGEVQQFC